MRRAGVCPPAGELRQVTAHRVFKTLAEVLDGRGVAVVAVKVQIKCGLVDDFRAFFVDRRRIKVVDLNKAVRARRVRKRACVFAELMAAQAVGIINAFDRGRAHVCGELLVAVDCQPFFQAQLEPVAAGNPVARPVVKILVRDDRLDTFKVTVR